MCLVNVSKMTFIDQTVVVNQVAHIKRSIDTGITLSMKQRKICFSKSPPTIKQYYQKHLQYYTLCF